MKAKWAQMGAAALCAAAVATTAAAQSSEDPEDPFLVDPKAKGVLVETTVLLVGLDVVDFVAQDGALLFMRIDSVKGVKRGEIPPQLVVGSVPGPLDLLGSNATQDAQAAAIASLGPQLLARIQQLGVCADCTTVITRSVDQFAAGFEPDPLLGAISPLSDGTCDGGPRDGRICADDSDCLDPDGLDDGVCQPRFSQEVVLNATFAAQ